MNSLGKKILRSILIAAFFLATLFLAGCGDSELVKGITEVVKRSVEGEVNKKVGEIKKQLDRVINLGTGKDQKEEGQGTGREGKEKPEKDSGEKSAEEKG